MCDDEEQWIQFESCLPRSFAMKQGVLTLLRVGNCFVVLLKGQADWAVCFGCDGELFNEMVSKS
jgi:hypothetical protein